MSKFPYDGDPKIFIDEDGADWNVGGGQPEMEQGIENELNYSLFTSENWSGNYYLKETKKMGSDFEKISKGVILSGTINDIRQSALNSFNSGIYGENECTVSNPNNNFIKVEYIVRPPNNNPSIFLFTKNGINWANQIIGNK